MSRGAERERLWESVEGGDVICAEILKIERRDECYERAVNNFDNDILLLVPTNILRGKLIK